MIICLSLGKWMRNCASKCAHVEISWMSKGSGLCLGWRLRKGVCGVVGVTQEWEGLPLSPEYLGAHGSKGRMSPYMWNLKRNDTNLFRLGEWIYGCWWGGGRDSQAVLIPRSGRSPGEGNSIPLQYSCLGNPTDRGAWWAIVHGVTEESDMT